VCILYPLWSAMILVNRIMELSRPLKMHIKYGVLDSTWRWNIEKLGNDLHCPLKINITYQALDSTWSWNIGKLGDELHHPLKRNIKYQALDSAWRFLVKYRKIGWWITSPTKKEYQISGTGFSMEICGEILENWVMNFITH